MQPAAVLLVLAGVMLFPLDRRAVDEALSIANSGLERTHRDFHADYRFVVNLAPVDFISIVTPFRRLVLVAATEKRSGRRLFGQRESLAALQPDPDRFEVYAELTFHPHNTFVGVPDYTLHLEPVLRGEPVAPREIVRMPRFGARVDDPAYPFPYPYAVAPMLPGGEPLSGGTLLARFGAEALDPKAVYDVVVRDGTTVLARTRVDLARLR